MSDSRWEQVKEVFQIALERTPGAERERYLNETCGADAEFRAEVLDLLGSFDEADDFLDESPIGEVAEAIAGNRESLAAGQQIGRYRIERKLGAGGMGEVFLAYDTELERLVALKILSAAFSGNADRVRRFVQEARAASALNHPNILTIYEIGHFENVRFIATEYVEGETLRERQRGDEPLALYEIIDVFSQTSAALSAAHAARIVHRDIKPENIMIRRDGLVKVLDFGLAKLLEEECGDSATERQSEEKNILITASPHHRRVGASYQTQPGIIMGTVAYMSPEQARGLPTDARTDVWSLGVCLSEIVFGVQPFAGETVSDQIAAILKSEPGFGSENLSPALRRMSKNVSKNRPTIVIKRLKIFRSILKISAKNRSFRTRPIFLTVFRASGKMRAIRDQTDGKPSNRRFRSKTVCLLVLRARSISSVKSENANFYRFRRRALSLRFWLRFYIFRFFQVFPKPNRSIRLPFCRLLTRAAIRTTNICRTV